MPDGVGHELHWSLLRPLLADAGLPRDCDECPYQRCHEHTTVTDLGDLVYGLPDMPGVVSWPGCPLLWACLRRIGADARPLSECLEWLVEIGAHRGEIGGGAAGIYREYLLRRDLGETMMKTRTHEQAKTCK